MGRAKYGDAFLGVKIDDTQVGRALKRMQKRFDATAQSLNRIGKVGVGVGAAVVTAGALAVATFAGFDDQMRQVKAVTGAAGEQFVELTEQAKRLGATTSFSASQVANMMGELGRAGFAAGQIKVVSDSVLNLSSATGTELPRAAEIAGAVLRGFGEDADQMIRVTDVLTATANGTAQSLDDLFEALKPVAPIAAAAGESLEDTAAAVGVLANSGIKGSLAGNALARAFKNLATEKTQDFLAGLGVAATDSEGNLRPLIEIIGDLDKATADFGEAERLATFETLFGRGQAAAIKLAEATRGGFAEVADAVRNSQGVAAKTAAEMEAGIGGSFRRMMSSVEGVAIALGDSLAPTVAAVTETLGGMLGGVTAWINANQNLVVGLMAGGLAVGALGAAAVVLGTVLSSIGRSSSSRGIRQ